MTNLQCVSCGGDPYPGLVRCLPCHRAASQALDVDEAIETSEARLLSTEEIAGRRELWEVNPSEISVDWESVLNGEYDD